MNIWLLLPKDNQEGQEGRAYFLTLLSMKHPSNKEHTYTYCMQKDL